MKKKKKKKKNTLDTSRKAIVAHTAALRNYKKKLKKSPFSISHICSVSFVLFHVYFPLEHTINLIHIIIK